MPRKPLIHRDRHTILAWLILCAALIAAMVAIGGYTRLSGSGLSITSWKPIHGIIPPRGAGQWEAEFLAYRQSPQYIQINRGMTLPEFKAIFWPEYIHRLLGRIIGAVFFIPLVIFAWRGSISKRFGWRLAGIFALGGAQGLIGWLMVASGLVDSPYVSPIRLALHLSVALAILGLLVWAVMDVVVSGQWAVGSKKDDPITDHRPLTTLFLWFLLLCLQIILGAFMAGTHAGLIYNTWPDMNGQFLPDGLFTDPVGSIQFFHRNMAVLVAVGFLLWWYCTRNHVKKAHLGGICGLMAGLIAAQFALGVLTLLNAIPLPLAMAHQMIGMGLFVISVVLLYNLVIPAKAGIQIANEKDPCLRRDNK